MKKRWIFRKQNIGYRFIAIFTCLLFAIIGYFTFNSVPLGTFFLFMFSYFLGAFRGRRRIDIIENQSLESAISEICKLIDSATTVIYILSRSLNPKIYSQIDVYSCLEKAKKRGVIIKIIADYNAIKLSYEKCEQNINKSILKLISEKRAELFHLDRDLKNVNHFMVVDRTNFRFEEEHEIDAEERKAILVYRSKRARSLHSLFDDILAAPHCVKILSDQVIKLIQEIKYQHKENTNET